MKVALGLLAGIAGIAYLCVLVTDSGARLGRTQRRAIAADGAVAPVTLEDRSQQREELVSEPAPEEGSAQSIEASLSMNALAHEQTLDEARAAIEASVLGVLDPIAVLELAEVLLSLEADKRAVPEPDAAGALVFPIQGTPNGVNANLEVTRSSNPKYARILCLSLQLEPPSTPYYLDGIWREPPGARIKVWTGHDGKVLAMGIMTSAKTDFRESRNRGVDTDGGTFTHGTHYYFDPADSSKCVARPYGYSGGAFKQFDGQVALERSPTPERVEDLSASMLRMYDKIRQ
jgi:hypothetical protein